MAVNLLTYLSDQFTTSVNDQLAGRLGESPGPIGKAVNAIIPTVLGGLAQRTQTVSDADEIVTILRNTTYDDAATPLDIAQVTDTAGETQTAISSGSSFIEKLLPNRADEVAGAVAQHSGINRVSAHSLMNLVGAALAGTLGRQTRDNGLTGLNLSTLMAGQLANIKAATPAALAQLTGFDKLKLPDETGEAQRITTFSGTPVNPDIPKSPLVERERENISWLRWAMIAVGALILFLIIQKCRQPQTATDGAYTDTTARTEPDAREDTSATARASAEAVNGSPAGSEPGGPASLGNDKSVDVNLPGGRRLRVAENSFNANLAQFLAGKDRPLPRTFTFENLTFETGSARITG